MMAKKKGGGKLSRSEVVTVRLDPKLRFAAELAARKQRRTLSSFIECAIEQAVENMELNQSDNENHYLVDALKDVWDVEEADRLVKLAVHIPELLTFDEERTWKLIKEQSLFWNTDRDSNFGDAFHKRLIDNYSRENWDTTHKITYGEAEIEDNTTQEDAPDQSPTFKNIDISLLNFKLLRENWDTVRKITDGEAGIEDLTTQEDVSDQSPAISDDISL
ncbi:hypothetical protein [Desulfosediminicola ganghwensis]|uniref:hypothetical protein n=1 Tax=Desulfosediminicola ganghwensis TaxID=2569540 RepID=UPI0010ACC08F|nr:hypothetical protein [Desulfosediminicola ganghwensis]